MRNSRIAIVQPYLSSKGGAANIVIWLAKGLEDRGHEVTIFTLEYDKDLWSEPYHGLTVRILRQDYPGRRLFNAKKLKRLYCSYQLRKHVQGFDLVNVHNQPSHLWAAWARKKAKRFPPIVWYCQEPKRNLYWRSTDRNLLKLEGQGSAAYNRHLVQRLEKYKKRDEKKKRDIARDKAWDADAMGRIDLVLTNSEFTAESIRLAHNIEPQVCYLGIPMEGRLESDAAKEQKDYILVVSPLQTDKNVHNAIEAFHLLIQDETCRDLKMKIIGFGECENELRDLARKRGLSESVEFLGFVPDDALAAFYREALLSVYLPLNEPFGLVSVESQCRRTPIVVSKNNGLCETIRDNATGVAVDCLDPAKIAQTLKTLCSDRERLDEMGREGRNWSMDRFNLPEFVDRFEESVAPLLH
ncbi:MAG: glycosyltransferase family 4 protein [Planctomycetota bacterium]|jgi:glycosyltransferase involved in cell wall biosynthesis